MACIEFKKTARFDRLMRTPRYFGALKTEASRYGFNNYLSGIKERRTTQSES
jgi:hypothetical protein